MVTRSRLESESESSVPTEGPKEPTWSAELVIEPERQQHGESCPFGLSILRSIAGPNWAKL
jgi:hypothetical protein